MVRCRLWSLAGRRPTHRCGLFVYPFWVVPCHASCHKRPSFAFSRLLLPTTNNLTRQSRQRTHRQLNATKQPLELLHRVSGSSAATKPVSQAISRRQSPDLFAPSHHSVCSVAIPLPSHADQWQTTIFSSPLFCSIFSDCCNKSSIQPNTNKHAFAVLLFHCLSCLHAHIGARSGTNVPIRFSHEVD